MNRLAAVLILSLFASQSCDKKSTCCAPQPPPQPPVVSADSFVNPLLASGPDPWVIRKDSIYYYTHTLGNKVGIWKTKKMSELRNATQTIIWTPPATGTNSKNIWAPELHYLDNKWYVYYTAGASTDLATQRTFVLENPNADPTSGVWTEKGQIRDSTEDYFAIDGTVLTHNGKKYFAWSGHASPADNTQRLYIAGMANPWTLDSKRTLLSSPEYPWEKAGAPPAVNEGPEFIINPQGRVVLVYSASGCWTDDYALGVLMLKAGGDPLVSADWTKHPTPVFVKQPANGAYGPGHNSFFKSIDGQEEWILYHANPSAGQGCQNARNPRMQRFTWKADGTPDFGIPVKINTNVKEPSGE